jgi:hypothetical protein
MPAAEFQRDKTGGKMSLDSGRRFGALRYAWHGRLLSDWSQPHSARAMVAILLPMGSINSEQRSETAEGVARESEGRTRLPLLRPLRQDQPRGHSGARLCSVPLQQGRAGRGPSGLRGRRGVRGGAMAGRTGACAQAGDLLAAPRFSEPISSRDSALRSVPRGRHHHAAPTIEVLFAPNETLDSHSPAY